ncbi:hypothetical protein CAP36_10705 [Chitinophagaceae bacterium IBVUCB2]|nr:hypothetical protein CAP36_10705 [Chitinophagaceae bacterium IBVUCB2]
MPKEAVFLWPKEDVSHKMWEGCIIEIVNGQVLLQAGYFITSSPEQKLIENILLKLKIKVKLLMSSPD